MHFNEYKSSSYWMKKRRPQGAAGTVLALMILAAVIGSDIVTSLI